MPHPIKQDKDGKRRKDTWNIIKTEIDDVDNQTFRRGRISVARILKILFALNQLSQDTCKGPDWSAGIMCVVNISKATTF